MSAVIYMDLSSAYYTVAETDKNNTQNKDEGTNLDTVGSTEASPCHRCETLELQLATARSEKDAVLEKEKKWRTRYSELKSRSDEITRQMAGMLEKGGAMENVNDDKSNINLGKKFEKINSNERTNASEWLEEHMRKWTELERISFLKSLMMKSYELCERMAENQLRSFLFLSEEEKLPTPEEIQELHKIRRKIGQKESTKQKIKQTVCQEVLGSEVIEPDILQIEGAKDRLSEFLELFSECCWLMIFSQPKLKLQFDVVGEPYEGKMKEKFSRYACQDKVEDTKMEKDSIKEVVWPCVELEDGSWFYAKGEVIIVEEGIKE